MGLSEIRINYKEKHLSEFSSEDQLLIEVARETMKKAHAPYSNFKVGCTVRLSDKTVIAGNNQENAAYPSGLCAERVALFSAKSNYMAEIDTIVVVAKTEAQTPANAYSCGNCRQVMMEYANLQDAPIRILMQTNRSTFIEVLDVKELLPFYFNSDSLQ
jgi:cytidine deaminase